MLSILKRGPVLAIVAAIALVAVGGAAFTAANTVPESSAGEGNNTVSGFTLSNIVYNLHATNPSLVISVVFTAQSGAAAGWPAALTTSTVEFDATVGHYVCSDDGGGAAAGTYVITCATIAATNFYETGLASGVDLAVVDIDTIDAVLVQ